MIERLRREVFRSILFSAAGVLFAILLALNLLNAAQTLAKERSVLDAADEIVFPGQNEKSRGRGAGRGNSAVVQG